MSQSAPAPGRISNLRMLWRFAGRYPFQVAMGALALLVAAAASLAVPYGFKLIIDKGLIASGANIRPWFELLLGIVAVLAVATAARFYFVSWIGERVVADVRVAVQDNLLRLAPPFFEENRPSEIASRLTADTTIIEGVVGSTVSVTLRNVLMGIGAAAMLFVLAPRQALSLLLVVPLVVLPITLLGRRVRNLSRASQDRVADIGATIDEVLGAMKVVQAYTGEGFERRRFGAVVERVFATAKRRILFRAVMTAIVIFLLFGAVVLVIWSGATDVQSGRLSGGTMAAFVLYGGLVVGSFGALAEVYGEFLRGAGAAGRIGELLREEPGIAAPAQPVALPQPPLGRVTFDRVTFRYPTRPDVSALHDFSLDVAAGETVAVVGPSGAGKSTLFQLLERFYDPQEGQVRLDGIALPAADPMALRQRLAIVPQESVIFAASARDNLRYGRWDATDDQLWAAARAANAAEFLEKLPEGLETFMGEGGARLSGGQRQRLAIARAILRDAPVLLLDEATSALDAESERLVQEALERLMRERTTLVIAHRLATVRAADRIIVMENGRIVEQGRHDDLARGGGLYERLARLQFEGAVAGTV